MGSTRVRSSSHCTASVPPPASRTRRAAWSRPCCSHVPKAEHGRPAPPSSHSMAMPISDRSRRIISPCRASSSGRSLVSKGTSSHRRSPRPWRAVEHSAHCCSIAKPCRRECQRARPPNCRPMVRPSASRTAALTADSIAWHRSHTKVPRHRPARQRQSSPRNRCGWTVPSSVPCAPGSSRAVSLASSAAGKVTSFHSPRCSNVRTSPCFTPLAEGTRSELTTLSR